MSALLFALSLASVPAPGLDWQTIRSQCCDIHFPSELLPVAERVANIADESVASASAFLKSAPLDRIQVVIHDVTDSPNGFTQIVPYDLIDLRTITPESDSDLAVTDEYLRLLVQHEILHVVHLDIIHGLPALVNFVVGKVWAPNFAQPRFVYEGLATYVETKYTQGGRLTAELFTSELRIAALANDLWSLDDVSNYSRRNPGGSAAYVYGAAFARWLADRHGPEVWSKVAHDYGGDVIPFAIARTFNDATGTDFEEEWAAFIHAIKVDAERFRKAVDERGGATPARRLTRTGGTMRSPAFLDADTVVVTIDSPHTPAGVYTLDATNGARPRPRARTTDAGELTTVGGDIIVAQSEVSRGWWSYTDLWRVDGENTQRVTHEARVRHPSPIAGTRSVVAEHRSAVDSALVKINVDSGESSDVVRFTDGTIAYSPNVSPDGQHVVYSRWTPGGARDIVERNLKSGDERTLTFDAPQDLDPTYTPDGKRVLFASDREGTFAIYAVDRESKEMRRIVDTLGLARDPAVSPDGNAVLYVDTHIEGQDLYATDFDWDAAPVVQPSAPPPQRRELTPRITSSPEPYNPLPTLLPRYFVPLLANDPLGAPAVGVAVVGEDAAALFSFSAQATYGLGLGRPAASMTVRFNDLYTPISVGLDYRTEISDRLRSVDGEPQLHVETVLRGSGSLSIPLLRRRAASHALGVTYAQSLHVVETQFSSPPDARAPTFPPPNNIGSITLDWGYTSIDVGRDSVSNERGFTSFIRLRHANKLLLSDQNFTELFVDARAFHPVPGLGAHVVGLYLSGGVGIGDPLFRTGFSLGGFEDRDITRDLLGGFRSAGGVLRGYPSRVAFGDAAALSTLEYRFPLLEMEQGIGTLPFFVERLHGAVFSDLGVVFGPVPAPTTARASLGAELRLEFTLAYYGLFIVRAGYARGVNADGVDQPYVVMGFPY